MTMKRKLEFPWEAPPPVGETREVAAGVRWLRMPLPFALDHINLWLLDDGENLLAVDTGFGQPEIEGHWQRILADLAPRTLSRIVVTHYHPDHLGLAAWLQARTGAPVSMTQSEFLAGHAIWHELPGHDSGAMVAQFEAHGLDPLRLEAQRARGNPYRRGVPSLPTRIDRLLAGQVLRIGAHDWHVLVGYGHSPEHASLYCEALGTLISGDMLLPTISTNVSVNAAMPHADPLGWFLDSLRRIKDLPADTLVLPSHGLPFRGLRERVAQLEAHHQERCNELLAACDRPRSAGELLGTLFRRELDNHQVMFAMGEAVAHLNHLAQQGALHRIQDGQGPIRYLRTE